VENDKYPILFAFRQCADTRRATLCEFGIAQSQIKALAK
jgi:hypothetical protein